MGDRSLGSFTSIIEVVLLLQSWPCHSVLAVPTDSSCGPKTQHDRCNHDFSGTAAVVAAFLHKLLLLTTKQRHIIDLKGGHA